MSSIHLKGYIDFFEKQNIKLLHWEAFIERNTLTTNYNVISSSFVIWQNPRTKR